MDSLSLSDHLSCRHHCCSCVVLFMIRVLRLSSRHKITVTARGESPLRRTVAFPLLPLRPFSSFFEESVINSIAKKSLDHDKMRRVDIESVTSKRFSELAAAMASCEVTDIGKKSGVKVISLDFSGYLGIKNIADNKLYVRDFYPDLLAKVRKMERCVLTGNPGIGKSFFQFYYLARILNTDKFGPLPPNHLGSTDPPKIVIRQVGDKVVTIFDVEDKVAGTTTSTDAHTIIESFDSATTVFMMEPERSKAEPPFGDVNLPMLLSASPDVTRYKEFCKNGGRKLFMPVFKLAELQDIGEYLLECGDVPEEVRHVYTEQGVEQQFKKYGGIIRHVLPTDSTYMDEIEIAREAAIREVDAWQLLTATTIEKKENYAPPVSHLLMQFDVQTSGEKSFGIATTSVVYTADDITPRLKKKIYDISIQKKIELMVEDDRARMSGKAKDILAPEIYEAVIADRLCSDGGVHWQKKTRNVEWSRGDVVKGSTTLTEEWEEFDLSLGKCVVDEDAPSFAEMIPNQLYYPTIKTFPFVEFFYKSEPDERGEVELVAFQVTRQKPSRSAVRKVFRVGAMTRFLKKISLRRLDGVKLRIVLIPCPRDADNAVFVPQKLESEDDPELRCCELAEEARKNFVKYEVWRLPTDYSSGVRGR